MEKQRILTEELIKASEAYYNGLDSGMSDLEFDRKVEELRQMEAKSGVVLPGSPTVNVGAKAVSDLPKVKHEQPALSLDKVKYKDREDLVKWLKNSDGHDSAVLSWKCDGNTTVLEMGPKNGTGKSELLQAATRGDGIEGNDITRNAPFFKGVPKRLPVYEKIVVRGEAIMTNAEFERVNAEAGGIYQNARNLASATIKMLDANESRKREIQFKAFELVVPAPSYNDEDRWRYGDNGEVFDLAFMKDRFRYMKYLGFDVVPYECVDSTNILDKIEDWKEKVKELSWPTDGLVISFNDMVYGMSLGATERYFRHSLALKWTDETVSTTIRNIEWSVGKTGTITPVAEFDTVRLGIGSNVSRASLHNISIMSNLPQTGTGNRLPLMIGSKAEVYLANMIIPQIASIDGGDKYISIPDVCPVCGAPTSIEENNGIKVLRCTGSNCAAQQVGKLMNTFSKDGLFVKGLGESQIEDLLNAGLVTADPLSFYRLKERVDKDTNFGVVYLRLLDQDGWGPKKWDNLMDAIEASRDTTLQKFLYSLNVPLLGNDLSKKLAKHFKNIDKFFEWIKGAEKIDWQTEAMDELASINGVGEEKAAYITTYARSLYSQDIGDIKKREAFEGLIKELHYETETAGDNSLEGLTFVITGSVHEYKNRDEFKASVESRGGKVAGSVSSKTSYLVCNSESESTKSKKARDLGIEVLTEDEFISRFGR